jgi:hypothetical protein
MTILLLLGIGISSAHAEEPEVSGSASVDIMNHYVWRGFKLSNGVVIQPSVGITYGGFGANFWANYDTSTNEHNETDLTLNYSFSLDKFSFDLGYIYYALDAVDDTQEFYLSVGYDILLNPTITIYYDFDQGDGAFVTASASHDFDLAEDISLSLGALASYNIESEYSIGNYSDFHNGELSASVSIPINKNISIGPMIAYSFPLSDDAEDAFETVSDDREEDILYGGLNFSLSF